MYPVKIIILGCGGRGGCYAEYAKQFPAKAQVTAVADPRDFHRNAIADAHGLTANMRFNRWEEVAARPKFADAVLICTLDPMHEAAAVAFAKQGYAILLEKPMASTPQACRNIVGAVKKADVIFAVCHVLRYAAFSRKIKEIIDEGMLGQVVSLQHLEPVGNWHQDHSYVRGNWRNEKDSSFMLLTKCCHDIDLIRYFMNARCRKVQSFGSLNFYRRENRPAGAASKCTDCPPEIERNCPDSAIKIYIRDRLRKGHSLWPINVLTTDVSEVGVMKALREGPYGRCVFACDNNVVDNQVVNMEFEGRKTASMTMTAFCNETGRQTRIFGTRGSLSSDGEQVRVFDFLSGKTTLYPTGVPNDNGILSGHGGGDMGLMQAFIAAVAENDRTRILSGPEETLESHLITFAAEKSRLTGKVLEVDS